MALDFSVNINPLGTPQCVVDAMVDSLKRCDVYPDAYCTGFRSGLAKLYGISMEHIICGNGATELIDAFTAAIKRVCVCPDSLVVLPAFSEYVNSLERHSINYDTHSLYECNMFELNSNILGKIKNIRGALYLCSPSNPVGNLIDKSLLEEIFVGCDASGVKCLLDASFFDLTEKPDWQYMIDLVKRHKSLFLLSSFTKSHALAGVRLGFAFCGDVQFLQRVSECTVCWNVSSVAQAAGSMVVRMELRGDDYLKRTRKLLGIERDYLKGELEDMGFRVYPGAANYVLFKVPEVMPDCTWTFCLNLKERLLERGICIRDCGNYEGLGRGFYRVAVRTHEDNERLILAMRNGD